ncbi:hypothetical protein HRQ91_05250 [Treponema parvum]|uniref:Lipoprotein n=1 Tax=Treponema parvum TaxID=138851 RepID=A0A975F3W5_9SPIR|nr:hypothetical protein [Treponema parvum]QTQ13907.1 hypothetical protein HRQ91_05250 [Treponema parvum]
MKKPALVTIFVLAAFLLFTSCSNLFQALGIENNSGNGSLRIVLPEFSSQAERSAAGIGASRLAVNISDIKTYTVTLSKDGVVIAEETASAGSSLTFSDIEEGTYTIRGSAYDGITRLAYGSITARVSAGKTTNAAFPMYTTPPIVLWDYKNPDNNMSVYIADTAVRTLYGSPRTVPKSLDIMEFDAARNLYTAREFLSAASGYNPVELGNKIKLGSPPPINLTLDYIYCSEDNILFTVNSGSLYFCDPSSEDSSGKSEAIGILDGGGIIASGEFMAVSKAGTDNSRFLYTIKYPVSHSFVPSSPGVPSLAIKKYKIHQNYGPDGKIISMMNEPGSPNPDYIAVSGDVDGSGYIDVNDDAYGLNVINKKPDDPSINFTLLKESKVKDVRIHENEMYILFSYFPEGSSSLTVTPSQSAPYPSYNYLSCGALLKVKLGANGTPSRDEDFGEKGALGWTDDLIRPSPFALEDAGYSPPRYINLYGQWPSDENKGFFGPQKILALKSKKIWIADDGAAYDENKKSDHNHNNGTMSQKDRVVVVDLERESFESVYSFDRIGFSNTIETGSSF